MASLDGLDSFQGDGAGGSGKSFVVGLASTLGSSEGTSKGGESGESKREMHDLMCKKRPAGKGRKGRREMRTWWGHWSVGPPPFIMDEIYPLVKKGPKGPLARRGPGFETSDGLTRLTGLVKW